MNFLLTTSFIFSEILKDLPFHLNLVELGPYSLLIKDVSSLTETDTHWRIIDGYVRDFQKDVHDFRGQEVSTTDAIANGWPVSKNITGSFSGTLVHKNDFSIVICNDPIGLYPLYYLTFKNDIYISNSLILLGVVSGVPFDEVGVVQRCIGPEYLNFGSRTTLQKCKRLLPGEKITINSKGEFERKEYDNTLYQDMEKISHDKEFYKSFWSTFKKEVTYCLNNSNEVSLALSGGIDSRITLGALSEKKKISCVTFGSNNNYETKIAKKLARLKETSFQNFSCPEIYFPPYKVLKKYCLHTEGIYLCSWLEILENSEVSRKNPLFIGDLTTALTGRTITKYSTKEFRKRNFLKHQILKHNYPLQKANSKNWEVWKAAKTAELGRWYTEQRLQEFDLNTSKDELLRALRSDLDELFKRIQDHNLPYQELYDELFVWYTHTRMLMAKQILITNYHYSSFCPSMSMKIIRMTSSIHPNQRLNFRFLNQLTTKINDLKRLFSVPTSQAPYIPQNAPDFLKYPVWGLRSMADQFLIKRLLKRKNINGRYRLFNSINWVEVYQNPEMESNIKNYFSTNHIGEKHFQNLLKKAIKRKNLQEWPFANMDIMNSAALNVEMDIIKTHTRKR